MTALIVEVPAVSTFNQTLRKALKKCISKKRLLAVYMQITRHTWACMAVCCSTRRLLLSWRFSIVLISSVDLSLQKKKKTLETLSLQHNDIFWIIWGSSLSYPESCFIIVIKCYNFGACVGYGRCDVLVMLQLTVSKPQVMYGDI